MSARRILLVEDDDGIRQVATLSLQKIGGHQVLAVESGAQALAQAQAFAPELLVLDVTMPDMDGPETLQALRRLPGLAQVPALFLTARTLAREVARLRGVGAVDVIAKPFEPRQLCARVAQVFEGRPAAAATNDARPAVLVVEDDAGIGYLLRYILEQKGWRVLAATDGHAASQAIEAGEVTDAVLMDVMLPDVDGLTLLERLRALPRWQGVPVMMLTSRGDEASVARALAAGASDYLGKPFEPAELVARLERLRGATSSPSPGS